MSIINAAALLASAGGDYQIQRSVRLRSSASASLTRTFSTASTNRTRGTLSIWLKRGALNTQHIIIGCYDGTSTNSSDVQFNASNQLELYFGGTALHALVTSAVFRDPSAFYHLLVSVDTTQATAANRVTIYMNSVAQALSTANYPPQNSNWQIAAQNANNRIGTNWSNTGAHFDGYLADIHFIDGQALTPASFGETDPVTGVWKPKRYAGTYGTNGFYLNFADNSAATAAAIGKDSSGNGNNWTPTGVSVATGSAYDSMLDVPTMWADGGNGCGNYCVWSPLDQNGLTFANANLNISTASGRGRGTMFVSSGKWYWEVLVQTMPSTSTFGVADASAKMNTPNDAQTRGYLNTGSKISNGTSSAYGATFTVGDTVGVALDVDAGTLVFYKNGVSQGTAYSDLAGNTWAPFAQGGFACDANFGQRPFAYTPPTGFKALHTGNLPEPTIPNGRRNFDVAVYTTNGSAQTITTDGNGNALLFTPDFLWNKGRNLVQSHYLANTVTGLGNTLNTDTTLAEAATGFFTAVSNGSFSVAGETTGRTKVNWLWRESATAGFDIVTYTGNGTAQSIAHSLGVAPKMMIVKNRSIVQDWRVAHIGLTSMGSYHLNLNATASQTNSGALVWNGTAPTSSVFSVGSDSSVNGSGNSHVAYLFSEVAGFSRFGSYVGNGSTDGPFVFTGFRPRYVMMKRTDATESWYVWDSARNTYNVASLELVANSSGIESSYPQLDLVSNGFKLRGTDVGWNASGGTYIFAAFAESPFKYALAR